jgi:tetratricopeptide (TPR) repeat protein
MPSEQFDQMVQQLQKTPDDNALREKIINFTHMQNPVPAVPEDARRYLARGIAAVQNAKASVDFKLALPEFQNATNVAPWWPIAYFNLALVQEKLGDFKGAIANYHFYLLIDPNARDAEKVRTHGYELEYLAEQQAKPKYLSISFIGDASDSGIAHSNGGDIRFDLRNKIESNAIALLQSRFPNIGVNASGTGDAALVVTINIHDTVWDHSCGLFSCDVSVNSQLLISVTSPAGLHIDRPFALNINRNVSKGNSSFGSHLFAKALPDWIGQEALKKLQLVLNEEAVRTSLGNPHSPN